MSVTEQDSTFAGDGWGDGPVGYAPGESTSRPGDRTPPQDMAAEQSVLGAMLIGFSAVAVVVQLGLFFTAPGESCLASAEFSCKSAVAASNRSPVTK